MGCGNGFSGGRCADGSDTSDCVYESMSQQGAGKCVGVMHMVKIPDSYECKDQRGNYKCLLVKKIFTTIQLKYSYLYLIFTRINSTL